MSNKIWVLTYTIGTNEGRKSRRLICDTKAQAEMQQRVLGGEVVEYIRQQESFQVNWPEKIDIDEELERAQQCITELKSGKVGNALLERENHHVEVVGKLTERIAELESRTVNLPQRYITQFRKGFDDYYNEMVYKADEVLASLAAAGIEAEAEKIRIVLQELKEDGVLTTYSNGHVEMLPYRIDENGEEYVEMFPNDIKLH